jgi:Guanosine polyphosphate pyrophosphohydrolases/synthetases
MEEALEQGVITRGKWNDSENWDMIEPLWKKALTTAERYHTMAKSMYTDKTKDHRTGIGESYIKFIQGMMKILIEEVHILDDETLTVAAFYDIIVRTTYSRSVMEAEFGTNIAEMVQILQQKKNEKAGAYLARCLEHKNACLLVCIILAVLLQEERVSDINPFESWEEDLPHYKDLKGQVEPYISLFLEKGWDSAVFLGKKLLEQINENMNYSRNMNKTAEELYEGWNDDNSWVLAHYRKE